MMLNLRSSCSRPDSARMDPERRIRKNGARRRRPELSLFARVRKICGPYAAALGPIIRFRARLGLPAPAQPGAEVVVVVVKVVVETEAWVS